MQLQYPYGYLGKVDVVLVAGQIFARLTVVCFEKRNLLGRLN